MFFNSSVTKDCPAGGCSLDFLEDDDPDFPDLCVVDIYHIHPNPWPEVANEAEPGVGICLAPQSSSSSSSFSVGRPRPVCQDGRGMNGESKQRKFARVTRKKALRWANGFRPGATVLFGKFFMRVSRLARGGLCELGK
jgi:hypothetical protein